MKINIQVRIKEQTAYGQFNDCLYFDYSYWQGLSEFEQEILVLQQTAERVAKWIEAMTTPPPVEEVVTQFEVLNEDGTVHYV